MKGYTYDNNYWPWIMLLCICKGLFIIRRHWYHMTTIYDLGPSSVDFLIVLFLWLSLNLKYGTIKNCIWNELMSYDNISLHWDDYLALVILLHSEHKNHDFESYWYHMTTFYDLWSSYVAFLVLFYLEMNTAK